VYFTGALTLTNGASLVLPGGVNITTAAGDVAVFVADGTVVRCTDYARASGQSPTSMPTLTNSLAADVAVNSLTSSYVDGPSVAQGTSGKWFATGTITLQDTATGVGAFVKLWDGATVIASTSANSGGANLRAVVALSGVITNPAGNIRISAKSFSQTTTFMRKDGTDGNNKDSTLTVVQIG
jgi:hypothetical protein